MSEMKAYAGIALWAFLYINAVAAIGILVLA